MAKVEFFALSKLFEQHRKPILEIVERVYSKGKVLQGDEISSLESEIAKFTSREYAVAVSSCTDALYFALLGSGIGPKDEVISTAFSFVASGSCIPRVGAKPVFVDIEPDYYMMDLGRLKKCITKKTKAIIVVNLFGQMMDMDRVIKFADENGLIVIEDAAQSLGARFKNKPAGSSGKAGCISFDPTKVISAFSTAGMVATDDDELARFIRKIRYHGKEDGKFKMIGYNSQIPSLQAAILSYELKFIEGWEKRRTKIANMYINELADVKHVELPKLNPGSSHTYHKFVIKAKNRDALRKALEENSIQTKIHYQTPLPFQPCMKPFVNDLGAFPVAKRICQEVLSLPIYPTLCDTEVKKITDTIIQFYSKK